MAWYRPHMIWTSCVHLTLLLCALLCRFGGWKILQDQDYCLQCPEAVDRGGTDHTLCTQHICTARSTALDYCSSGCHWYALIWYSWSQWKIPLLMNYLIYLLYMKCLFALHGWRLILILYLFIIMYIVSIHLYIVNLSFLIYIAYFTHGLSVDVYNCFPF